MSLLHSTPSPPNKKTNLPILYDCPHMPYTSSTAGHDRYTVLGANQSEVSFAPYQKREASSPAAASSTYPIPVQYYWGSTPLEF